ncbi:uncharacterized protein EKO05_0010828 [Ascochyta rabiei]|uniref:uncharacterized protein n=1 Tax=Didymella rabiei TaxID=5454 RepID=UPI00220D6E36|nr:uncharacterized protein EKO05_0010828 [Ascochyta rabiei]UPX20600.1 hypothetical protein EKO05_0010828 [Ascochyta rabiei]
MPVCFRPATCLYPLGSHVDASRNKYRGETPFFIDGARNKILILLHPKHVKHMLRSATECDPNPYVHEEMMHQLMSSPHAAVNYYKCLESTVDYDQMV